MTLIPFDPTRLEGTEGILVTTSRPYFLRLESGLEMYVTDDITIVVDHTPTIRDGEYRTYVVGQRHLIIRYEGKEYTIPLQ